MRGTVYTQDWALREALFNLLEQASEEGRWRLQAILDDLDEREPGPWIVEELRTVRPWLMPRPVDHARDAADAVAALIQALEATRRAEPELEAAVAGLQELVGGSLDPKTARRLARRARELRGFALRSQQEQAARLKQQGLATAAMGEALARLQERLSREGELGAAERSMLLRDLEEAQLALRELGGVLEQDEAPEAELGQVLELVG